MKYLHLPRLQVANANAQPSAWLVAAPSPTAYMGFAHNLGRRIGFGARGVAIVHHDYSLRAERIGRSILPHQFRAASLINGADYASTNKHALSLQPSARCDVCVSLIIEFPEDSPIDLEKICTWIPQARVAGGTINAYGRPRLIGYEGLESCRKGGHVIAERSDLMTPREGERDVLDAFLRATQPFQVTSEPWVLPALLGYRAITPITARKRARDDYPHAFAEPLIGLVQYQGTSESEGLPFWRYAHPEPDLFLVTTQPQ